MGEQIVVPKAEFIEDVAKFMEGKTTDVVLASLAEQKKRFKASLVSGTDLHGFNTTSSSCMSDQNGDPSTFQTLCRLWRTQ
jgi:hypothetical protein